jgi:hypothetical protein
MCKFIASLVVRVLQQMIRHREMNYEIPSLRLDCMRTSSCSNSVVFLKDGIGTHGEKGRVVVSFYASQTQPLILYSKR